MNGVGSSAHGLGLSGALSRPLTVHEGERLAYLDRLKFFLATAPSRWDIDDAADGGLAASLAHQPTSTPTTHPALNRFLLPSQEYVSCVLWNGLYHITGTDIVRALVFRFEAFARPVRNMKKFEEGVFSDLRNLKPGADACLEEPKLNPPRQPHLTLVWTSSPSLPGRTHRGHCRSAASREARR
ncbi:STE like transcription factor-domain-containing protein [Mycena sp. CBHHK59/15]|nr:STE like transcription factor-domain-containing protein [Mycena sp. CBHHK59/15]